MDLALTTDAGKLELDARPQRGLGVAIEMPDAMRTAAAGAQA
ncbi:MAG: hypothetical protein ACLP01_29030 [Solirubrobacteraceae bacterium]